MTQADANRPVRVIVVDDSKLMRSMISAGLRADGTIEVIAEAADTSEARRLIRTLNPDVITLDVEMPGMDGIAFLRKIMDLRPMPVIMVSTLTAAGTDVSIAALQIGAVDALPKPSGREEVAVFGKALRDKVHLAARARVGRNSAARPETRAAQPSAMPPPRPPSARRAGFGACDLIAIGASTGGVGALSEVLEHLPPNTPPIIITQHMPALFTSRFAARLNNVLPHGVSEATDGEVLRPGEIRIAPGERHITVVRGGNGIAISFDDSGAISGHKPSVDVMFNSVSTVLGARAMGVILTGMGRDGAAGLRAMHNAGAFCIGQNEESCVVYGMPRAARELGAVDEELDLKHIAGRIGEVLNPGSARKAV